MFADLNRVTAETFVARLEYRESLGSTNDLAIELARQTDLPTPLLVLAGEQTAGRGRGANRWWSAPGGLAFSLVLGSDIVAPVVASESRNDLAPAWPRISLAAALAVQRVVRRLSPATACGIRWPNDVHAAGRKICGVLPELVQSIAASENGDASIVPRLALGVGLNVNNSFAVAPPELRGVGISLFDLTGCTHDLTDVLIALLVELAAVFAALARNDAAIPSAWSDCCLLTGRTVELQLSPGRVRGLCRGIDATGALLLDVGGQTQRFYGGVIARVE